MLWDSQVHGFFLVLTSRCVAFYALLIFTGVSVRLGYPRSSKAMNVMSRCRYWFPTGLGAMGFAMATNLQQFLGKLKPDDAFAPSLHVWNRTLSKADALVEQGATKASSIEGMVVGKVSVFALRHPLCHSISLAGHMSLSGVCACAAEIEKGLCSQIWRGTAP